MLQRDTPFTIRALEAVLDHRVVRISITTHEVNIQRLSRKSYSDRLGKGSLEVYISVSY